MLKKRIIFTLFYDSGEFVLSRNFTRQIVGSLEWLKKNYNFSKLSFYIDELVVLDITRGEKDIKQFCSVLSNLTKDCFMPISAGGGVRSIEDTQILLRSGADKIVINSLIFENPKVINGIANEFGKQCLVCSVDLKRVSDDFAVVGQFGQSIFSDRPVEWLERIDSLPVGELYLNSVDRDGTGQGYDLGMLNLIPRDFRLPVIIAGGVGNEEHLAHGLMDPRVDAVATGHLFNFIGDGLKNAREYLICSGFNLPSWPKLG